jgi:phosphatidate phosphatase APP1
VLANTFLREFQPAPEMQPLYAAWPDAAFHYVSAGPMQLSAPIAAFLSAAKFPEGSLHMRYFRFHLLDRSTWDSIGEQILDPAATFDHKIREITAIMRHFPGRKFILVGDSGEKDPEIYREIRNRFGEQVLKIIIRDVAGEPDRLEGMEVLPAK